MCNIIFFFRRCEASIDLTKSSLSSLSPLLAARSRDDSHLSRPQWSSRISTPLKEDTRIQKKKQRREEENERAMQQAEAAAAATHAAPQPQPQLQPQIPRIDAVTRAQAALSDFVFLAFNAAGSIQRDARPLPVAGEDPNSVAPAAGAAPGLPPTEEQARAAAAQLASAASDLREAVSSLPSTDAGASAEEAEAAEAIAEAATAAARLSRARRNAARRVEGGGQELFLCLADAELARRADEADAEREE